MLTAVTQGTFSGLEDTLLNLDVSYNRLSAISELPLRNLLSLNLAGNQLKRISPETFKYLPRLQYLNLSSNPLYGGFPPLLPSSLTTLDISRTDLKILPAVLLTNLESLEKIYLSGNYLKEIGEGTFQHLYNLTTIDMSHNVIEKIDKTAFQGISDLYELNLSGNKLTTFVGEYFDTGTGLQLLDLSDNRIAYLSATAFVIHPRLRRINLSGNQFTAFPSDYVKSLQFLEFIDLSGNGLKTVNEFAFSQMPRLRQLDLSSNRIETVDELVFHNSTQLQTLDLSNNNLETLSERALEGVLRLERFYLNNNKLSSLPETIFDASRVRSLERIDLSGNNFNEIPVRALTKQSASLVSLRMSRNRIMEVYTQELLNNVTELDLSENPLSDNAARGIMGEAKILRSLNLAKTGLKGVTRMETPFLKHLNISGNKIREIDPKALERATMLETLDVSRNRIGDFVNMIPIFRTLPTLLSLDVSANDIKSINESSFDGLKALRSLKMTNLTNCTKIEKSAFKHLTKLENLHAHSYPKLGYFDIQGILKGLNDLEELDVEIKDSSFGNEQLSLRTHPRLKWLSLRGERLRSVQSNTLVGARSSQMTLALRNTSIDSIPAALFFPVPRSTRVKLDVTGSKFTTLTSQLIAALDERGGSVKLKGLNANPINCNCESKHLYRWLKSLGDVSVKCQSPDYLANKVLADLSEAQLSCDKRETTTTTRSTTTETTTSMKSTTSEPEIIWTVAPTTSSNNRNKIYKGDIGNSVLGSPTSTDDTLIIGIVGGVVAFIAIVIIVVCICRLRWSNQESEARMAAIASSIHEASMIRPGSAYSGKMNQDLYISYNGSTLGHGNGMIPSTVPASPIPMMPPYVQQMHIVPAHNVHHTNSATPQPIYGYYDNSLPMYMTCTSDSKFDR